MKRIALIATLCLIASTVYSQSITIGTDGIVRCKGVSIGTTQTIFGDTYEVVDRNLLFQRRNEGKDLTKVCVSNVTDMSYMFDNSPFNQAIGNWDVSNVTNMGNMFTGSQFNQNIENWDVSNVTNMIWMFAISPFNQPIGSWDVRNVRDMGRMFTATSFNHPIGDWNVSNVNNMQDMFNKTKFNHPIGDWNVSKVKDMREMFYTSKFNHPIGNWDVSSVTNMRGMFLISQFNQPIGNWDVSNVLNMSRMFGGSPFNQPIGNWDVSSVTDMSRMFSTSHFNQPIVGWCVIIIKDEPLDFSTSSPLTTVNKPQWGTCGGVPLPTKPTLSSPQHNSTDVPKNVELSWVKDEFSTHYQIQLFEGFEPTVIDTLVSSTTFVSRTILKNNFVYNWRVRGINENKKFQGKPLTGEWSSIWKFTTQMDPVGAITLLFPQNNSTNIPTTPTLRWNKEPNSQTYTVQLSTDEFSTFVVNQSVTDTTLTTPTLKYSTNYRWRVRGSNTIGDGDWSQRTFTTQMAPVGTITLLAPGDKTTNSSITPALSWRKEANAQSYTVQLSTDGFATTMVNQTLTDTTLTAPTLTYLKGYQWRVRGTNSIGAGPWSPVWSFTTQIEPVGRITLLAPLKGSTTVSRVPEFRWNPNALSTKYQFQLFEGFDIPMIDSLMKETAFVAWFLFKDNTQFSWRVRGIDETRTVNGSHVLGEWSEVWSFTTLLDTSVEPDEQPTKFNLAQNYPNPFNPTTQIGFSLPQTSHVRLEVYSITGQLVTVLRNEITSVGNHTITFDARNLSSGVYIVKMTTPEYTQSRLVNLIK